MEALLDAGVAELPTEETSVPGNFDSIDSIVIARTESRDYFLYKNTGDQDAFQRLVHACGSFPLYIASQFVRDIHEAEDLVQEAWMKALQADNFDYQQSFKGWFGRIVRNVCLDYLRKQKRRKVTEYLFSSAGNVDPDSALDSPAEIDDPLIASVNNAEVQFCLNQLDEKFASVLRLQMEGHDTAAIARILNRKEASVRWRRTEAYDMMRRILTRKHPIHQPQE